MEKDFPNSNFPKVVLIGLPNVGKSSLFNRLVGQNLALEDKNAGTTKDWRQIFIEKNHYYLVDTAGLDQKQNRIDKITSNLLKQIILSADLLLWVIAGANGLSPEDKNLQRFFRQLGKKVWLVVNKIDNSQREDASYQFNQLGIKDIYLISAVHNRNIYQLKKDLKNWSNEFQPVVEDKIGLKVEPAVRYTIIGRPNVGKSNLFNAILDQERSTVSEQAGTTRDTVQEQISSQDINWQKTEQINLELSDTAGVRRGSRLENQLEIASVKQAIESIDRSDVVLAVLDASSGLTKQDLHLAGYALDQNKSLIMVVNKWDLIDKKKIPDQEQQSIFIAKLQSRAKFLGLAPIIFVSASTRENISDLRQLMMDLWLTRNKHVQNSELQKMIDDKIYPVLAFINQIEQIGLNPPKFRIENQRPLKTAEIRQLKNALKETFSFFGVPIELQLKEFEK